MSELSEAYKGRNVVVTGGTGFKGAWMCLWLASMGANVTSIARNPPTQPSHFDIKNIKDIVNDVRHDLKNLIDLNPYKPDIVFHLAASAIVALTFDDPRGTLENNIMSTVNILEACRKCESVKAAVCISTDKVYSNKEWDYAYREIDELGGTDPYSCSKVCIEHIIGCYRHEFFPMIATARAGNVIGGGDFSFGRLIPDIVRATITGQPVEIHTPNATRPWQFILEPLAGYLMLGARLLNGEQKFATNWNFGPQGEMTVLDILETAQIAWPKIKYVVKEKQVHPSMVKLLKIDSTESMKVLGWRPAYTMKQAVKATIEWYKNYYCHGIISTESDIIDYQFRMNERK